MNRLLSFIATTLIITCAIAVGQTPAANNVISKASIENAGFSFPVSANGEPVSSVKLYTPSWIEATDVTPAYDVEFEAPELEFVCELKVSTDPEMVVGETAHGERKIIPITGGTFKGPKLEGVVLSGGADYQYTDMEKGRVEIEAIYTVKTVDSVLIHIRNVGLLYVPEDLREILKKGEKFDPGRIYFRAAPKFEAPINSKYDWMNNAIFVCKGIPARGYVSIQVWKIL
jgi:hypothetical protein